MLILGVDPGLNKTGYAVVEKKGSKYKIIDIDVIKPKKSLDISKKVSYLYKKLDRICGLYDIQEAAVEELFFVKNVKSGIKVGQMRGVILLTLQQNNIDTSSYSPTQIKKAVVGTGKAKKSQVKDMVKVLTGFKTDKKLNYDAYDAAACAICHLHSRKVSNYDSIS